MKAKQQMLDVVIWSKPNNDIAEPSVELFITEQGALGINVGGNIIIKPIDTWFNTVDELERYRIELGQARARISKLEKHIVDRLLEERIGQKVL